jgi:hypothetical protein
MQTIPESIHDTDAISPSEYFDSLASDLGLLGMIPDSEFNQRLGDFNDYDFVIQNSTRAFDDPARFGRVSPSRLRTELGKAVYRLSTTGLPYQRNETMLACMSAEGKFVNSLDPADIAYEDNLSPLIITHENKPVAVIKSYGEQTALGLDNVDEHHIVKGALLAVSSHINYSFRDPAPHPFTLDAETMLQTLSGEQSLPFQPIRFTSFMIPGSVRENLKWWYYSSQDHSVDDIAGMVDDAMGYAKPLPIDDLWTPKRRFGSVRFTG